MIILHRDYDADVIYVKVNEPILMINGGFEISVLCLGIRGDDVLVVFYYGSIIAVMLLYANTISIMKKIKSGENTELNTAVGCILAAFILLSILSL